ncbi:hypothetical protein Forpi1262_v009258 [Fusarium oxysporum f. sp. raphani]|uniref:Uncharacterized protein n=1 Tax=Fusarium oxysporum f. sp. raphani TaxID=96318 RepID=A0A8J5PW80_FUSOX|nr:hypothetical protein Forpi1262_v009258 [Fusarium oxysporum f. sp. raphani]KAJ4048610.1 hypothetical protein NW758_005131 [Fusarium oxysporum]
MPDLVDNVDSNPEGPRHIGTWSRGEHTSPGLIEWTTAVPEALKPYLATVQERIPTDENRPEETRTLVIDHLFNDGRRNALIYSFADRKFRLLRGSQQTRLYQALYSRLGRQAPPEMYQHPEYQAEKPLWSYQVWSLMMVLSEITEWQPLDKAFQDDAELRSRKLERKRLATSPGWNGAMTAEIFQYGFGFLEKDRNTLEEYSEWEVKRFYDELCKLLEPL